MSQRPFSPTSRFAVTWLLLGLGLVAVSIYLGSQYPLPIAGNSLYSVKPSTNSLMWLHDPYDHEPARIYQLDLATSKTSTAPHRMLNDYGHSNSRGRRINLQDKLEIIDNKTGQVLWSGPRTGDYGFLVGDSYLVEPIADQFRLTDLDLLTGLGSKLALPADDADAAQSLIDMPGVKAPSPNGFTGLFPLEATNRFLYHFEDANPRVTAFEIIDGNLHELASWLVGTTTVVLKDGSVMTAAPSGSEVEVRSLTDFQLTQTYPMPPGLKSWTGLGTGIVSRNDLFSFTDIKTGNVRVYRFDDFTLIPELDMPIFLGGMKTGERDDRRYVIFGDSNYRSRRLVVYDSVDRRIVADRQPTPMGIQDIAIADGMLVIVNETMGLTVEMTDLSTGATKLLQPFAWILYTLPVVLIMALLWLVVWLRVSAQWPRLALLNVLLVAVLFVTPQIAHVAWLGNWEVFFRPALGYCFCLLLVSVFYLSVVAVFGKQRVMLRTLPLWLVLAGLMGLANLYVSPEGIRGLNGSSRTARMVMQLVVVFGLVSSLMLIVVRWWRRQWISRRLSTAENRTPSTTQVPLRDIFFVTAAIAAFVAAAAPNRRVLLASTQLLGTSIWAIVMLIPILPGLLALTRTGRLIKWMNYMAVVLALLLIVEITMHLWMAHWHREIWYNLLLPARFATFLFLATYGIGLILRPRLALGYSQPPSPVLQPQGASRS